MNTYFNGHCHTHYSNIRLLDSINRPKALIDKAIELGLSGVAITDHEAICSWIEVNQYAKQIKEKYPDFKIALGNEIYLTETRERSQKFYHFILIAKDALGAKALREMSSIAWNGMFNSKKIDRVPLLKSEMVEVMNKYKGHVIASTACLGGELPTKILELTKIENGKNKEEIHNAKKEIHEFLSFCLECFGNDFYLECQPGLSNEQIIVNKRIWSISKAYNIPVIATTDAHYLTLEQKPIHAAYLKSKDGDRETDSFYDYTYLMDYNEILDKLSVGLGKENSELILKNTLDLQNKIEDYDLTRKQTIPKVELEDVVYNFIEDFSKYPVINYLLKSDNKQEKYWIVECLKSLKDKKLWNDTYLERINTEADVIKNIGEKLDDCLFAYFNTFKHYIDLFWDCGSIVGPGRGSATGFLSNYLLGITQLDPIRWDLPYWRFLNNERAELPDIDIDLAPSVRPKIFEEIRKQRGEFGLVQVATFGTEATKSAIQTACRGYRSKNYPDGIDSDDALYMSSLIPQERGFLWDIEDVINGNEEKDRKPVTQFITEVNKYPGLLDIIVSIVGLINKRSSHASGVILYADDPYETAAFMKTPSGDLITCYDLHDAEAAGDTKYDFLVTEVCDKMIQCLKLLQEDGVIEKENLRFLYNKYLHPEILNVEDPIIWDHLEAGDILDVFQFNEGSGLAIAKKLKPRNIMEMLSANAMMRLMSEKGMESQQDRYVRIQKNGLKVFEQEMIDNGLNEVERKALHKYCDTYYGCVPIQEQMMEILMDENIANFTLGEANAARKIVAKKKMKDIPKLRAQVFEHVNNDQKASYIWDLAIRPSLGYAFSKNHSLPYSFVGAQAIILATHFNSIYWDTACLIVNSGSLEKAEVTEEIVDIYEPEMDDLNDGVVFEDLPDRKGKIKRTISTDYGKIAKALGDIRNAGINISLIDINKSSFSFKPDPENNQILFGLKAALNINDDTAKDIINNRPYASVKDFVNKVHPKKQTMISLIKGGAFDKLMDRKECMVWYIWETCDKKSKLNLQNMPTLIKKNLIPTEDKFKLVKRVYEFNRYLKSVCYERGAAFYTINPRAYAFLDEIGCASIINKFTLNVKIWDKIYNKYMDIFRKWISENQTELLTSLNDEAFLEDWHKYAEGTMSSWEMSALCFYYHDHELKNMNTGLYGIVDFYNLPEEPEVTEKIWNRAGKEIRIFKLHKICGTCIAKNKNKSTISLLTTSGVVTVKFRKEYFALFDKQISVLGEDGKKHVCEKSWFNRGSKLIIMGMRSGDDFIVKKYASTPGHQLYQITDIDDKGNVTLKDGRYGEENEV